MEKIIRPERTSVNEKNVSQEILGLFKESPIPSDELLGNLPLFLLRKTLSRIISLSEIYKLILNVSGNVFDFGTRWGTNLALFANFRGMYEPYNANRKVVGFDTFEGLRGIHQKDEGLEFAKEGVLSVTPEYETFLAQLMACHEAASPVSHIKKYELVKGDAVVTLKQYLGGHPETIIAMAYFDMDIYQPTKACLEIIKEHVTKGSVICFDQLNFPLYPGETVALKEVLGLSRYAIQRKPDISTSYIVID